MQPTACVQPGMTPAFRPQVIIHTDGSYRPNLRRGGWSGLMECYPYWQVIYGNEDHTSISRMELQAVINCLNCLTMPCDVVVYSDSAYVVNGMMDWLENWSARGWRTKGRKPVEHQDLWEQMLQLMQIHRIQAYHVRGHAGNPGNELCDYLAASASLLPV